MPTLFPYTTLFRSHGYNVAEPVFSTELGRDARVVHDVVAMLRAGRGLQDRRHVRVRDAQAGEVSGLIGRISEAELWL